MDSFFSFNNPIPNHIYYLTLRSVQEILGMDFSESTTTPTNPGLGCVEIEISNFIIN